MERIEWSPGIGDPTFLGWFTVVAYFLASALCGFAMRHDAAVRRRASLWLLLGALLFCLGINKQLDLQTLLTEVGRVTLRELGMYESRRPIQVAFILVVLVTTATGAAGVIHHARSELRAFRFALVGLLFLGCFIVVRAASFHHVDWLLGVHLLGVRLNGVLELSGIFMIGGSAAVTAMIGPKPAPES